MKKIIFRNRETLQDEDYTTYEGWGEPVAVEVKDYPAGGRVMAEQYGERLSYMRTFYVTKWPETITESAGAYVEIPYDAGRDPDYKLVSIQPWGTHKVLTLEKVKR
ncbi:hypothetical protein ACFSL6_08930 [Paenibacillus thailandensis]|uniref:Uncharacterized protein n=1 Tax=Paenibacillus thailandensis TaxID=393250 RepID=A0ABW5QST5_9BACL